MSNEEKLLTLIPESLHGEAMYIMSKMLIGVKPIPNFGKFAPQDIDRVERFVCELWDIQVSLIHKKTRHALAVNARQFMFYYLRNALNWTIQRVAQRYNLHHASVVHALSVIDGHLEFDKQYSAKFDQFLTYLNHTIINDKQSKTTPESNVDSGSTPTDVLVHRTIDN